jgi:hypothetical protein
MAIDTTSFVVGPLRGMDQRWRADPTGAVLARDLTWDARDGWKTSGGYRRIAVGTEGNPYSGQGAVMSIHWFTQHNGARQFLVYETEGGALRVFNGSRIRSGTPWDTVVDADGDTLQTRVVPASPYTRTQSQSWGGRLYITGGGYATPLVYDGTKAEEAGFSAYPPAPSAEILPDNVANKITGVGTTATMPFGLGPLPGSGSAYSAAYRWRVAFINERGQISPPGPASDQLTFSNTTTGRKIAAVYIPTGPPQTVARIVWRTQSIVDTSGNMLTDVGAGGQFYFLRIIRDNSTTMFEDGVLDSELGSLLDENDFGLWPSNTKHLAVFKNVMFVAGMTNNEVRYSRPLFPEMFPPDNVMNVGDADTGPITGMYPTKNALVVTKNRGIYLIKGDPSSGFYAETLTRDSGCVAGDTIVEIPGIGLAMLGEDGVNLLEGALENTGTPTRIVNLSQQIPQLIKKINRSAVVNACAACYHRDKELWIAVPTLDSATPNLVLVFHYEVGAWTIREDFPISCMLTTRDHRGYLFFGSWDSNNPGIHVYSRGWQYKGASTEIAPRYESAHMDLGALYRSWQPAYVLVHCIGHGGNMEFDAYVNRGLTSVRVASGDSVDTRDQQYTQDEFPVYGTAVWGTGDWARLRPVTLRFDLAAFRQGPVHELQLVLEPAGRHMHLIQFDIEAKTGEQRNIRAIQPSLTRGTR